MPRYHTSITPPITFVAATAKSALRSNPRRCKVLIPVPPGTTCTIDLNEPGNTQSQFAVSGATYPLVIDEDDWGDITERAITLTMSNPITLSIIEVFDMERKT